MNEEKKVWLDGQINGYNRKRDRERDSMRMHDFFFRGVQDNPYFLVCTFDPWSDKT
jgi:hypothetical protein